MDMCIFLGSIYKPVLPLGFGTSLVWKVKNFFIHVSMLFVIITHLFFDSYGQFALQNTILLKCVGLYIIKISDLCTLINLTICYTYIYLNLRMKISQYSICVLHCVSNLFTKTETNHCKLYHLWSTYCMLDAILEIFYKLSDNIFAIL